MKNIFYFRRLCRIGGTEQFLYEIAKKYAKTHDITIFYSELQENGGAEQLKRLREKLRCIKYEGRKVECDNAFYNFNLEMIEDVEAKEQVFVAHANYEELGYKPPIDHPKLTRLVGVSKFAQRKLQEYANMLGIDKKVELCYNPLTLESPGKVLRLISTGRLDDRVRGGERLINLIGALDRYCQEHKDCHYTLDIFSNPMRVHTDSPNVCIRQPRIDVRPFISNADFYINVPNDMETYGYGMNEALGYGVPIVATPLSIIKELPITENELITLEFDCSNIDEVARQIFEKKVNTFEYEPPTDNWNKLLATGKPTYEKEKKKLVEIQALRDYYDLELEEKKKKGDTFKVYLPRADYLCEIGFAKRV